ncbi:MAG: hypothetical protein NVS9B3_10260 [Gemmatimonadaceae bacterium]
MSLLTSGLAGSAALAAAVCSAADGALRARERSTGVEGPTIGRGDGSRARRHRALLIARFVLFLTVGVAVQSDPATTHAVGLPGQIAFALVVAALAEALARAIGDAAGGRSPLLGEAIPRLLEVLCYPLVAPTIGIDATLARLFPPSPARAEQRETAEEQFRQVVAAEADVGRDQQKLLTGVFSLGDTEASHIMMPRVDIVGVASDARWSELVDRVRSAGHSRLPVFERTIDDIVGVLYAKDLLAAVVAGEEPPSGWTSLVRPATFIPPTKPIDALLREFKASGAHIAIVTDEFGGTAGLVTIEDVLEEIVGEIRDERDREEPDIEHEGARRWWVSGRVTLDELSDVLEHGFSREGVTTVAGLVYELLGRVPRAGERLRVDDFLLVVERVRRRSIERVYIERLAPSTSPSTA